MLPTEYVCRLRPQNCCCVVAQISVGKARRSFKKNPVLIFQRYVRLPIPPKNRQLYVPFRLAACLSG